MYGSRLRRRGRSSSRPGCVSSASVLTGTRVSLTRCSTKRRSTPTCAPQIRHLDSHIELLTERYDQVVWHLHVLHREIRVATHRLIVEQAKLKRQQQNLAQLLIEQYKGGDPHTIEIVLGLVVALADHERHGSEPAGSTRRSATPSQAIDAARAAIAPSASTVIDRAGVAGRDKRSSG